MFYLSLHTEICIEKTFVFLAVGTGNIYTDFSLGPLGKTVRKLDERNGFNYINFTNTLPGHIHLVAT